MNPLELLEKYFPNSRSRSILLEHSRLVAAKAVAVARSINEPVDRLFVEQAALLHDIGICRTSAPDIGCHGTDHYLLHGIHGRAILEYEGLPRHALVCERHIGVGLKASDISAQALPLPLRDMSPTCIEEEIVSYADLFFSKKVGAVAHEKTLEAISESLTRFGADKAAIFQVWVSRFGNPPI